MAKPVITVKADNIRQTSGAYTELYNSDGLHVWAVKSGKFEIKCGSTRKYARSLQEVEAAVDALSLHQFPSSGAEVRAAIHEKLGHQFKLEVHATHEDADKVVHTLVGSKTKLAADMLGVAPTDVETMDAGVRYSMPQNMYGGEYMILIPMNTDVCELSPSFSEPQLYEDQQFAKGQVLHGICPLTSEVISIVVSEAYPNGTLKAQDGTVYSADEVERLQFSIDGQSVADADFHEPDELLYQPSDIPSYNPVGVVKDQAPVLGNLQNYDNILNASAGVLSDFMKTVKGAAYLDRSSLNKVTVTAMNNEGQATDGAVEWNCRIASPSYKRTSNITIPLQLVNGSIDIGQEFIISTGQRFPLSAEGFRAHLGELASDDMFRHAAVKTRVGSAIRADHDVDNLLNGVELPQETSIAAEGTIADLEARPELELIDVDTDINAVKDSVGEAASEFDAFFINQQDGEYTEVYGFYGIIPALNKPVFKIVGAKKTAAEEPAELSAGFTISTGTEDMVKANAEEKGKTLTDADWEVINKDCSQLERNAMKLLESKGVHCRDEGHSEDNLIGSCWPVAGKEQEFRDFVTARNEDADPADGGYFYEPALYDNVSELGSEILDVHVTFFDLKGFGQEVESTRKQATINKLAAIPQGGRASYDAETGTMSLHSDGGWDSPELSPPAAYSVSKKHFKDWAEFKAEYGIDKMSPITETDKYFIIIGGDDASDGLRDMAQNDLEEDTTSQMEEAGFSEEQIESFVDGQMWEKANMDYDGLEDAIIAKIWADKIATTEPDAVGNKIDELGEDKFETLYEIFHNELPAFYYVELPSKTAEAAKKQAGNDLTDSQLNMFANSFVQNMKMYKDEIDSGEMSAVERATEILDADSFTGYPQFSTEDREVIFYLLEESLGAIFTPAIAAEVIPVVKEAMDMYNVGDVDMDVEGSKKLATGEPDEDYDVAAYDQIVEQLAAAGFPGTTHKEFDKYQGVYLKVPGVGKFWTVDSFSTGERQDADLKSQYSAVTLLDSEGNKISANAGDYFSVAPDYVFEGHTLILKDATGKETRIEDPKKSDLPSSSAVRPTSFTYKPGTETTVMVLALEGQDEVSGEVTIQGKSADASGLIEAITAGGFKPKTKGKKQAWKADGSDITPVAEKVMSIDSTVWNDNKWQEKADVDMDVLKEALKPVAGEVTEADIAVLTDYNFHSAVKAIREIRNWKKTSATDNAMLNQYLATALWSSSNPDSENGEEPMDANHSIEDFTAEARAKAEADISDFLAKATPVVEAIDPNYELTDDTIGHDFWLTRNGHGAGFWDGDYPEKIGKALTEIAQTFSGLDLIVNDDGKVEAI